MYYFKNREEAGKMLARELKELRKNDVVVYALPRGGVVTGYEVARYLCAPLDIIITRKIGHPNEPEYAIAASAENGHIVVGSQEEIDEIDKEWFYHEIEKQKEEAKRRRELYMQGKLPIPAEGKIAILVDDGAATGLTVRMGIVELRHKNPEKIIVAIPIVSREAASDIKREAELVTVVDYTDLKFLGSVGYYYKEFLPVEDNEVISLLRKYKKEFSKD